MSTRRVAIPGTTALNGGDAALLVAEARVIERALAPCEIVVFDQHPEAAQRYYPEFTFQRTLTWPRDNEHGSMVGKVRWGVRIARLFVAARLLRHGYRRIAELVADGCTDLLALETYASATLVCTPGGTMLNDNYNVVPRLADWLLVLSLGRPLVLFTQSFDAFERRSARLLARRVLSRAALVLVRGNASRDRAIELGARPEIVHVAPDAAFSLQRANVVPRPGDRRVAISVREWPYFASPNGQERYEHAIAGLCRYLVEQRASEVAFLSTCQGADEYWTDDSHVADRIVDTLPAATRAHVVVDREYRRPDDLRDAFAGFDVVVATRLHAAILALDAGTPAIPIAYEGKTHEVFTRLDLSDLVVDIDGVNVEALVALVDKVLDARADYAARAVASVASEADAAARVADLLRDVADVHAASSA